MTSVSSSATLPTANPPDDTTTTTTPSIPRTTIISSVYNMINRSDLIVTRNGSGVIIYINARSNAMYVELDLPNRGVSIVRSRNAIVVRLNPDSTSTNDIYLPFDWLMTNWTNNIDWVSDEEDEWLDPGFYDEETLWF